MPNNCSCARYSDDSVNPVMRPVHAVTDPCYTMASVTGRRRKGSIRRGTCTNCGWSNSR